MPLWLHRTTKQLLPSVASADLPEPIANYIEEPDLSAVQGIAAIYWNIVGDIISEMSQAEKDAVDAQNLSDARDRLIQDQVDLVESVLRQVVVMTLGEINILRQWIVDFQVEVAAATNLNDLKTRIAGLPNLPDRTFAQIKTQLRNNLGS
jgi:hypothetical protein